MEDRQKLIDGASRMGIELTDAQQDSLMQYMAMLVKWNKVYNLISRKETNDIVSVHLLDSLSVLPYINGPLVIDVGTGAGLPGIPLAIMRPDCSFTLLDSNSKKGRFRTQAVIELGLKNVTVVNERAEKFDAGQGFNEVISRAFATVADMLSVAGHMVGTKGRFLAMKGVNPQQELDEIPAGYQVEDVHPLEVPYLGAERHLAVLTKTAS